MIRLVDAFYDAPGATCFLYKLLAERKVSESISHKRHPSFEEHEAFINSRPYLGWYIICDGDPNPAGTPWEEQPYLGTCYITKYREVGIWLMPDAKGRGAGKEAMRQLLAMHPGRVFTNTSIHNDGAFAFYSKLGFRHCANMLEHDNDGIARSSDHSGKVEQQQVATQSLSEHWRITSPGVDVTSGEDCPER